MEEEGVGRQEADDQARPLALPFPSYTRISALFAFLSSPPRLLTPAAAPPRRSRTLDRSAWFSSGWPALQHRKHHFTAILRTFYPKTVPRLSLERGSRERGVKGVFRGGRLNTADRQGFDLGPAPSATCPSHSFLHRSGNSFVWSRFSLQKKKKGKKKRS